MGETFEIHTDGGSRGNPGPAAIGITIQVQGKDHFAKSAYIGVTTNNVAEYEAVNQALDWFLDQAQKKLISHSPTMFFYLDSKLVVEQLKGVFKIKQPHILVYVRKIHEKLQRLEGKVTFTHVPREKNAEADALVNQALDAQISSQ